MLMGEFPDFSGFKHYISRLLSLNSCKIADLQGFDGMIILQLITRILDRASMRMLHIIYLYFFDNFNYQLSYCISYFRDFLPLKVPFCSFFHVYPPLGFQCTSRVYLNLSKKCSTTLKM